jgi:hypothetical protein
VDTVCLTRALAEGVNRYAISSGGVEIDGLVTGQMFSGLTMLLLRDFYSSRSHRNAVVAL